MDARAPWRVQTHRVIFEADTPNGKAFDVALIVAILCSVLAVILESVPSVGERWGPWLRASEWIFTALFSVEFVLRLVSVVSPWRYVRSFFGIVDLLSILPSWLALLVPGTQSLLVIRALRLLRVFRVLKLSRFLGEANVLIVAIRDSSRKVVVFLGTVVILILIMGTAMYLIEGEQNGFTSIPRSMYWAVVTITTVGYGDLAPQTPFGQVVAAAAMILGYAIIAVPTGIVTAEIVHSARFTLPVSTRVCSNCVTEGHDSDAAFCKNCGAEL